MKYMLLIYSPENAWTKEEWTDCTQKSAAICHELAAKGQFLAASPLHPVATAKTVRIRDGKRLVTAGPFAETTEQLGGYYILDVPNLDEAIAVAGRLPPAKKGTVEIRPVLELHGLPAEKQPPAQSGLKQVMMLCYDDEQAWQEKGPEAHQAAMNEAVKLTHRLDARGQYVTASPLHPVATATSVRVRDGKRLVTDGPFAETREILGGYYVLSVKNLDEVVDIAAQHPGLPIGTVEVREIYDLSALLPDAAAQAD
jgi:hypothetical protein